MEIPMDGTNMVLSAKVAYKVAASVIMRRGFVFDKDLLNELFVDFKCEDITEFMDNIFNILKLYEAKITLKELEGNK